MFGDLGFIGFGFTRLQIDDDVSAVLGFLQPIDSPRDLGVHGIAGNQNPEAPLHAHEFAVITRHNLVDIHREFIHHFLGTFTYLLPLPSIGQRKRAQALFKLTAQGHIIGVRVLFCDRVNERSQRARGVGLCFGTSRRYEPVQGRLMNRLDTRGRYRNREFFWLTRVIRQAVAAWMRCKRILLGRERQKSPPLFRGCPRYPGLRQPVELCCRSICQGRVCILSLRIPPQFRDEGAQGHGAAHVGDVGGARIRHENIEKFAGCVFR